MHPTRNTVRQTLKDFGPLTCADIADLLFTDHTRLVSAVVSGLYRDTREVYICRWERPEIGNPKAVYALGNLPDAKKPRRLYNRERCVRWRRRQFKVHAPNSVWQWGSFSALSG